MDWKLGRIIAACLVLHCSASSAANNTLSEEHHASALSACKSTEGLAESIMRARQAGATMSLMMDKANEAAEEIRPLTENLVIAAFEQPRMSVEQNKERAAIDFGNDAYLECVKRLK